MRSAGLLALLAVAASGPAAAQTPVYAGYEIPGHGLSAAPEPGATLLDPASPPPDEWFAHDKALHAGGSFLLTLSGQYVLTDKAGLSNVRALPVSAATTLALGLIKEVADSRHPVHPLFSWRDLAADAAGILAAAAVVAW